MALVLSNVVVVLVLCFYKLNTLDKWSWEDIGYRTGFVSIAQLPLIVLLAGKDNIIGMLMGVGYERLNWLHRWTARTLWLTATLHMGFWFRSWARYNYITTKLTTDPITQRGFSAWCILTFVVITTIWPIRRLKYELFVITHLITFAGFIAAVWLHAPKEVKIWVWLPIGIFILDRLLRARRVLYLNLTPFHFWKRKVEGLWANSATFTPLSGDVTRITIENPAFRWKPGQHVFLSCHSVIPLQSHPFTIASLPTDGKLEFLVKAQRGGTKTFLDHAGKGATLPLTSRKVSLRPNRVGLEGPYGCIRDLGQFDSIIFFAGSTGATFTIPHMRNIVQSWRQDDHHGGRNFWTTSGKAITRRVRFVWVIKARHQLDWFKAQLEDVIQATTLHHASVPDADKEVEISIYVTCDEELVAERNTPKSCCRPSNYEEAEKSSALINDQKTDEKEGTRDVLEVMSLASTEQTSSSQGGCAPDGSCCCRATVVDESDAPICTCSHLPKESASSTPRIQPKEDVQEKPGANFNRPMRLVSGRPRPGNIIRKVLEEAEGESAVVVCGPRGLQDDVRATVVSLSDERAIHKGTGAQGIYLHVEGFCY
jgi:predicted ferric reductase